jgi:hypothetical protein
MSKYLQIEELPKNYQYYFQKIKELGLDDIRSIYLNEHSWRGDYDLNFTVWIDVEDMIDGNVKSANELRRDIMVNHRYFGIDDVSYRVKYKNKHEFANKFLPDLKREFKESKFAPIINSIRFDIKNEIDEPIVMVVLKKSINLTWDSSRKLQGEIKTFLNDYKQKNGLLNLDTRVV